MKKVGWCWKKKKQMNQAIRESQYLQFVENNKGIPHLFYHSSENESDFEPYRLSILILTGTKI